MHFLKSLMNTLGNNCTNISFRVLKIAVTYYN